MATPIPANRTPFTAAQILEATGGQMLRAGSGRVDGVVTDSRADVAGKLFVALRGESFDGHAFVGHVMQRGAAGVLIDRQVDVGTDRLVIRVPDTLDGLGALARMHRRRWGGKVVAIGGSAGKTTTRAAVSAVLDRLAPGTVAFERGNLNNRIGVPMVLLSIEDQHRTAVVEVGTNQRGEVSLLADLCAPDVAVLTLVDLEHTEGLGDLDAIEIEEGALLEAVGTDGVAIANVDDWRARRRLDLSPATTRIGYGRAVDAPYRLAARQAVGLDASQVRVARPQGGELEFRCRLCGEPGALAAAASVAVAEVLSGHPVDLPTVQAALDDPGVRERGRLIPVELADGTVVLDDTYNSNPASARSSILAAREFALVREARLVLVLGEMRELGAASVQEHSRLGTDAARSGAVEVIGVSGDARVLVEAAGVAGASAAFAPDAAAALRMLQDCMRRGDVVLVKASRGVRAERIVEGLVGAQGAGTWSTSCSTP